MSTLLEIGLSNAAMAVLLALVAAAAGRLVKRPALTHCLWLLVLLKLITPPLYVFHLPALAADNTASASSKTPAVPPAAEADDRFLAIQRALTPSEEPAASPPVDRAQPSNSQPSPVATVARPEDDAADSIALDVPTGALNWPVIVSSVWLAGSTMWFGLTTLQIVRFRRLLRLAEPAPAELRAQVGQVAGRLGLSRHPPVVVLPGAVSPMLWALGGATRLLLPQALLKRLDADQRSTLIAHELAHWRRCDHWVRLVELAVTGLYWWHPVVWWARSELRETEEQCCDAWVVGALPDASRSYALALLETVNFLAAGRQVLPPVASGIGHRHLLQRRLKMIMQCSTPKRLTWLGLLAVLGIGAVALPILPSLAQTTSRAEPLTAIPVAGERVASTLASPRPGIVVEGTIYSKEYCARCHTTASAHWDDSRCTYIKAQDEYRAVEAHLKQLHDRLAKLEGRDNSLAAMTSTAKAYLNLLQSSPAESRPRTAAAPSAEAARDEVELLEIQLKGKAAQVREVDVRMEQALEQSKRIEALAKSSAVSEELVHKARNDAQALAAQLDAKKAEYMEAQVKLAQAKRRLTAAEPATAATGKPAQPASAKPPPIVPPPVVDQPGFKVIRLKNADAISMSQVLENVLAGRGVRVVADPRTNNVVAAGTPADLQILEALVRHLDDADGSHEAPRRPMSGPGGSMPGMSMMGGPGIGAGMSTSPAKTSTGAAAPPMRGMAPGLGGNAPGGPAKSGPGYPTLGTAGSGGIGAGPGMMAGGMNPAAGGADSEQRLKQLELKLDRLEKLLEKLELDRRNKDLQNETNKALEPPKVSK